MSYFRICSMRSIQKTTFCGFIALLNKVLDFGRQLVNKLSSILIGLERDFLELECPTPAHLTLPVLYVS